MKRINTYYFHMNDARTFQFSLFLTRRTLINSLLKIYIDIEVIDTPMDPEMMPSGNTEILSRTLQNGLRRLLGVFLLLPTLILSLIENRLNYFIGHFQYCPSHNVFPNEKNFRRKNIHGKLEIRFRLFYRLNVRFCFCK